MMKRRQCETKLGRASKAEVQLAGWGSSLLNEAIDSSPRQVSDASGVWEAPAVIDGGRDTQLRERIAQIMARNDRRHHPRLEQPAEICLQQLSPPIMTDAKLVSAEVDNISRGGIRITSSTPLVTSSVVRCQIGMPDMRFAIPSLMQVVWLEQTGASQYSAGLRYLL